MLELTLKPNVLYGQSQSLSIEKVATLIGGNGSGKSTILHSIFEDIDSLRRQNIRLICTTSGQNENFSELFTGEINRLRSRKDNADIELNHLYFSAKDARYLIFLAISFCESGHVKTFFEHQSYITGTLTPKLKLKIEVPDQYIKNVISDAEKEALNHNYPSIRKRPFNQRLTTFLEKVSGLTDMDTLIDSRKGFKLKEVTVSNREIFECFDGARSEAVKFFIEGSYNEFFFKSELMQLNITDNIEFKNLSDGEYQSLLVLSLIDLFDSTESLFLLDEADSHLHFKNIENLWCILHKIKGRTITTTHLIDSIASNKFESIKVIEQGQIRERDKVKQLINRLNALARAKSVEFEVCAKIPHMAIMDDYNDWEIFKKLASRKGLNISRISAIYPIKKTSSYQTTTENFGRPKIDWVMNLSKIDSAIETTSVFLICDRDEAPLLYKEDGVRVSGQNYDEQLREIDWPRGSRVSVYLLAWKRREIKNYLLSYTALNLKGTLSQVNGSNLAKNDYLKMNEPCDNIEIQRFNAKPIVDPIINSDNGLDLDKLQAYIDLIPPSEISVDIENMYNFIVGKL